MTIEKTRGGHDIRRGGDARRWLSWSPCPRRPDRSGWTSAARWPRCRLSSSAPTRSSSASRSIAPRRCRSSGRARPSATTPTPRASTSGGRSPRPSRRSACRSAAWPTRRSRWPSAAPDDLKAAVEKLGQEAAVATASCCCCASPACSPRRPVRAGSRRVRGIALIVPARRRAAGWSASGSSRCSRSRSAASPPSSRSCSARSSSSLILGVLALVGRRRQAKARAAARAG